MGKRAAAKEPDGFAPVVAAFTRRKDVRVEPGWGEGNLVLKRDGKIFAMHVRGDLVAKLPKARVDQLVTAKTGTRFDPRKNGRVMKEWVVVAAGAADWTELAAEAYRFAKPRG